MSNVKHAPIIKLQATRAKLDAASRACAHWDHEGIHGDHDCCFDLQDARRAHRAALKAWRKAEAGS